MSALEKATLSRPFKVRNSHQRVMKSNVFDVIECMAALVRSEERRKCTELKLQLVHFQVLEFLSQCNKYSDTSAAITTYLGMTHGTVSQSLMILERREFIKKIRTVWINVSFIFSYLLKGGAS